MKKLLVSLRSLGALLVCLSVMSTPIFADDFSTKGFFKKRFNKFFVHPEPVGYDQYLTYTANGFFDPNVEPNDPNIFNCDPITNLCDGYYFQKEVIGRTDAEIAEREELAIAYFRDNFGLDVEDPANEGRIQMRMFQIDPRINLHVVSMGGRRVPEEGWKIEDGGWLVFVTDPNGFELSGEGNEGVIAPPGTFVVFSEYFVRAKKLVKVGKFKKWKEDPFVIGVQSLGPLFPGVFGFQCAVVNEDFGEGLVQGWGEAIFRPDGLRKMNIVGFITFPGLGDVPFAE